MPSGSRQLALGAIVLALSVSCAAASAAEFSVPEDYDSLQAAVDAVAANPSGDDTIWLEPRTYTESVLIDGLSGLRLRGRETARTTLRPDGAEPAITLVNAQNVEITKLTLIEGGVGIRVAASADVFLAANVLALGTAGAGVDVIDASTVHVLNAPVQRRAAQRIVRCNRLFGQFAFAIWPTFVHDGSGFRVTKT